MTLDEINKIRATTGDQPLTSVGIAPAAKTSLSNRLGIAPKPPNYAERVGESFSNIGKRVTEAVEKGAEGYAEGVKEANESTSLLGAAKGELKATGALLRSGLRTVGGVAEGAFIPIVEAPLIDPALEAIGEKIGNTEVGKKLAEFQKNHPEATQDVMDVLNTLLLGGGQAGGKPVLEATANTLKTGGKVLEESGVKAAKAELDKFVQELVRPVQTKAVKEAQVARTTEKGSGIFKRSEITPTTQEARMAEAVKTIPEVSSKNTFQQNFNIIKAANEKEAESLSNLLKENNFVYTKKELRARLNKVRETLMENPSLVGDNEKIAEKLISKINTMLESSPATGWDLLQLRKDFDAWVQSQKGTKIYDPKTENAFSITNREIRQGINDFLDEKAVNVDVKTSLQKQSSLYRAMDNIAPKAAEEADMAIIRFFQRMADAVGAKNRAVQIVAALAGIGGLGAASYFARPALYAGGLAFLAYKGGKLVLKPKLRIYMGQLLQQAGNVLSVEERAMIKSLIDEGESPLPKGRGGIPTTTAISEKAAQLTKKNGGATISLDGDVPTSGFAYSPYKDVETIIPKEVFSESDVSAFIERNLSKLSEEGNHLGIWEDDGKIYIDISKVNLDEQAAVSDALANNQIGLFDLSTFETKPLKNYEKTNNTYIYKGQNEGTTPGGSESTIKEKRSPKEEVKLSET